MYLVTTYEVIFKEEDVIKSLLETGEYGINGYPISHEAIVDFIKRKSFGEDIQANYEDEYPEYEKVFTIKDEDGEDLFYQVVAPRKMSDLSGSVSNNNEEN